MLHVAENNKLFTAAIEVRSSSFERQVLQQEAAKVVVGLEALTIVLVGPVLDQGILTKCLLGLEKTVPQKRSCLFLPYLMDNGDHNRWELQETYIIFFLGWGEEKVCVWYECV